jgi:hypothetical protein
MTAIVHSVQQPPVGEPATYNIGSDSYAGEVVAVRREGKEITIQTAIGLHTFTYRRKSGYYKLKGTDVGILTLGVAVDKRDPNF